MKLINKKMLKPLATSIYKSVVSIKQIFVEMRRYSYRMERESVISRYLQSNSCKKLQIGGGGNPLKGWLNTDILPNHKDVIFLDAREELPFESDSLDYIFCEHMIEHISYHDGLIMLSECFRVLKKNGKIRIATPNLKVFLDLFSEKKSDDQNQYMEWILKNWLNRQGINEKNPVFNLNLVMHAWGHEFIYDDKTLMELLTKANFRDFLIHKSGESDDLNLKELESHGEFIGNVAMNKFETLVIEAIK
jgi:predicted SAM-dependent methyltransferase